VPVELSLFFGPGRWFELELAPDGIVELQSLHIQVPKAESAILHCPVESHIHQISQGMKRKNKGVASRYPEQFVAAYENSMLDPKNVSPIKIDRGKGKGGLPQALLIRSKRRGDS